ncbi:hypothetical protein L2E82_43473 [Cichorium intybus]|uniref:Uncharacterized protein n=1 Tax=Cichorium intybus TaxID=13427 RepID=A0ACB8ZP51_CICIN|nr:hypothetical protein L2E82_43473 [Cichorium intybus]
MKSMNLLVIENNVLGSLLQKRLGQMNGVDVGLQAVAMYKLRDARSLDEKEMVENLWSFVENEYEKIDRLMELYMRYSNRVKEESERMNDLELDDLEHMMYGFGDDSNPLPETVALMEDIVMEYVTDMAHKAQDIASKRGKLLTEDFLFLIRNDLPKVNRCKELLSMNEELKQARKAFDVDEEKLAQKD